MVARWTLYRDFRFEYNRSDLPSSENDKVLGVALYIRENPSLRIAIDCSLDTPRNPDLAEKRCNSIRAALMQAGVSSGNIQLGEYGDKKLMPAGRIAVLVRTQN